ncbi:MAG: class II aldolase/adducin family protein [Acidobacteriia bacterium]|nr:class II aldolase/adducin family protein [Terriglobia bacterium]
MSNVKDEITSLLELSGRIGQNALLTQASTGNTSVKLGNVLWVKASGTWLAHARQHNILMPMDLEYARECVRRNVDPAKKHPSASEDHPGPSIETALHVVLPHRVVIHVHSVNTIAWAVREDAEACLAQRLAGLRWRWIPYVPSGLPLAMEIERALSGALDADVFVLGNHGLVVGGPDCAAAEALLWEVERRVATTARRAPKADCAALERIAHESGWHLAGNVTVHALATDAVSARILAGGLLYPCQAIFSNCNTPAVFSAVPCPQPGEASESRHSGRPFLIVQGCGVVFSQTITPAEAAILNGLAQVVRRIPADAPVRYLTEKELADGLSVEAYRYRELANRQAHSLTHAMVRAS